MLYLRCPFLYLTHFHFAKQRKHIQRILFGIKDGKRSSIQSHHDVGLGGLNMRHADGCSVDPVAQNDIARPDWDPPQGFPSFDVRQFEEITL